MKHIFLFILSLFLFGFISCDKEQKKELPNKEVVPVIEKKKVVKKEIVKKDWDSITPKNVVAFLTAYGKENKETVVLIKTSYGNIK